MLNLNLEKSQVELSVKMLIEDKMSKNRAEHQRQKRNELKKESIQLKIKDQSKNVDLPVLR